MSKTKEETTAAIEDSKQIVEVTMETLARTGKDAKVLQIPELLANSKEYKKLEKQMGEQNVREFFQKSEADLRSTIAECEVQEKEAKNETEANNNFKQARGIIKDFSGALRDALKPLREKKSAAAAIIAHRNEAKKA